MRVLYARALHRKVSPHTRSLYLPRDCIPIPPSVSWQKHVESKRSISEKRLHEKLWYYIKKVILDGVQSQKWFENGSGTCKIIVSDTKKTILLCQTQNVIS